MKFKGLALLVLSFFIGCASFSTNFTNSGWIKYYNNGNQIEMRDEDQEGIYLYRIPIQDTDFYVEGIGRNKSNAEYNANGFLTEIYFYGIYPNLLKSVDDQDLIINYTELRRYIDMVRFYK